MSLLEFLFERVLAYTAAAVMFLMMALTLIDVVGRDLFSAPLPGGFEVTELLLAVIIFLGLPLVTAEAAHVDVDICDPTVPERLKPYQDVLIGLINIGAFGTMAWMLWRFALRTYEYGDTTAILQIPFAGLVFLMAVMVSLSTLALIAMLFVSRGRSLFGPPPANKGH
ncbi:MAG TPA: TRAP transporter small permease [Azospirillum sp.]